MTAEKAYYADTLTAIRDIIGLHIDGGDNALIEQLTQIMDSEVPVS